MDPFYLGYKNNFKFEQEKRAMNKHKKSSSVNMSAYNERRNYSTNMNRRFNNDNNKDNAEDYQKLAKKFYCIIIGLQDELTRQTVKNYALLEENIDLKQKISEAAQINFFSLLCIYNIKYTKCLLISAFAWFFIYHT